MRDPNRIPIVLDKLKEFWEQYPDWRFGQLFNNLQSIIGHDMFYMEDEMLIDFLDSLMKGTEK